MPLRDFLQESGYTIFTPGKGDVRIFLAGLIQGALSIVGIIFFVMILYGGYLYLTAGGNDEQVSRAKKLVSSAIVGFVITIAALIITRFITGFISHASVEGPGVERESL